MFLLSRSSWSYETGLSSPIERNGKRKEKAKGWALGGNSGRKSWQWSAMEGEGSNFEDMVDNLKRKDYSKPYRAFLRYCVSLMVGS